MKRISARISIVTFLLLGSVVAASHAFAQAKSPKDEVVRNWSLVSFDSFGPAGTKVPSMEGGDLKGRLVLSGDGQLSVQIISEIPKLASKDRMNTTATEDKAVAHGVLSFFGAYTFDESDKAISFLIERSTFPNQVTGKGAKPAVTLSGNEMKFDNPGRTAGGNVVIVWKRIK
jgi:hypothetical protein